MLPVAVKILISSIIIAVISFGLLDEINEELMGWEVVRGIGIACLVAILGSILWIIWA